MKLDSYMDGACLWITPRVILALDDILKKAEVPPAAKDAVAKFHEQISHEAEIKRKRISNE